MQLPEFYRRWLQIALLHAYGPADAVAGVLGVVIPALAKRLGKPDVALNDLGWEIPLGVFAGLSIFRLILAPFWMFRDYQVGKLAEVRALTDQNSQLSSELEIVNRKLEDKSPRLVGEVQLVFCGDVGTKSTCVFCLTEISNLGGSQSIARRFSMQAVLKNGSIVDGIRLNPNILKEVNLTSDRGMSGQTITAKEMIDELSLIPIQNGAAESGWLSAEFHGALKQAFEESYSEILVSFEDIVGNRSVVKSPRDPQAERNISAVWVPGDPAKPF